MTIIRREPVDDEFKALDSSGDAVEWPYCVVLESTQAAGRSITQYAQDPEQLLRDTGHSIHLHLSQMGLRAMTRGQILCDWPDITVTWHVRFADAADSALFSFADPPQGLKVV